MRARTRRSALTAASLLVAAVATVAAVDFPKPLGYVNDFAGVLSGDAKEELVALLRETERKTTVEMAVTTVASLDGLSVEEYANKLFHAWGIGKRGRDNGVLLLVAPSERKVRI